MNYLKKLGKIVITTILSIIILGFILTMLYYFDIINNKMREKNERINVLEKKQIRDKLLEYFEMEHKKGHMNNNIYIPFSLKDLADYLAINRSAMFRELKHMKEEKLIQIKNRRVTLLYK